MACAAAAAVGHLQWHDDDDDDAVIEWVSVCGPGAADSDV